MTTPQIIILSAVILFDFIISIGIPVFKNKAPYGILQLFRWMFTSAIIFIVTVSMNDAKELIKSKCPELERIENVYKIK